MMSNIYSNFKKEKIGEAYLYLSYIYLSFVLLRAKKVKYNACVQRYIPRKNCLYTTKKLFIYHEKTVYIPRNFIDIVVYNGIIKKA